MPGEATLAHRGVLFLDELSEFPRNSIEALRQPLEDGFASIVRRGGTARFPTECLVVAATNPCPCGHGNDSGRCKCDQLAIERHRRRLSGPLIDRFDLRISLERPAGDEFGSQGTVSTAEVADRVKRARTIQSDRWRPTNLTNARAGEASLIGAGLIESRAKSLLEDVYARGLLSPRGRTRLLRVARTIADLRGSKRTGEDDLLEALAMRGGAAGGN